MKNTKILIILLAFTLLNYPKGILAQAPTLGTAANFVLFSSNGAVSNTGISQITGNVGTNNGSSTNFGNVNGVMHDGDPASIQCAADLLVAYNQLNNTTPTATPASSLGNGQVLLPGVYSITTAATLDLDLTLDAQGDANAVFIFKIQGAFASSAGAKVKLVNSALACNVFWKIEGMVELASGTTMRGTIIANNAAISLSSGDTLEGRALSTNGAVAVDGVLAYIPLGCGTPVLTGPAPPVLGGAACYAIFSSDGALSNSGVTNVTGDVGSNNGPVTGYDPLLVNGTIHTTPDGSTSQSAADLTIAYNYLNALVPDIQLLYPAQFGNNLVLTPHTYIMQGATTFTDTLYLNAQGNANAVFVIQINGALSTSTYSRVVLINGAVADNVFWEIEGAVNINDFSIFRGTIICNNAALSALSSNVTLDGRMLTTTGAIATSAMDVTATSIPSNCATLSVGSLEGENDNVSISIYPNPLGALTSITINGDFNNENFELLMYNVLGEQVLKTVLSNKTTTLETSKLPEGIYIYKVLRNNKIIQTGKLVSQQ